VERRMKNLEDRNVPAMLAAGAAVALFSLCGCGNQTAASDKAPTPNQARAFKGGEMTAEERAGMAKEQADAAAYRKAHPEQFPTEPAAPAAAAAPR